MPKGIFLPAIGNTSYNIGMGLGVDEQTLTLGGIRNSVATVSLFADLHMFILKKASCYIAPAGLGFSFAGVTHIFHCSRECHMCLATEVAFSTLRTSILVIYSVPLAGVSEFLKKRERDKKIVIKIKINLIYL